jgi:carbohydrate-selective porin OprB
MEDVTPRFIDGVSIAAGITAVGQGTTGNDDNPAGEDVIDGSISADLEISALLFEYGEAFMLIEAGAGEGLQDDEIVSFWGVNDDARDSNSRLELTEAWYEHRFLDSRLTLTVGKLDLTNYFDGNEVANDETTQFLAPGFVNSIAIEFPDNSPGARITLSPLEILDFSIAWQDGDGDFEDIFEGPFVIGEAGLKPLINGLQGNYRLYGWLNAQDHQEIKNPSNDSEDGSGAGVSIDQQVTDWLTLFGRLGYQDEDIYKFDIAWSAGLSLSGNFWGRNDDVLGIAYGQALLSGDYEDVLKADDVSPDDEGHFEAFYNITVNEHIAITPDIQIVINALGDSDYNTVVIGGMRGQITF